MKSRLLGAVGIVAVVGGIAGVTRVPVRAQSPSPITEPRFEVASVKPSPPQINTYQLEFGRNTWTMGPWPLKAFLGLAFHSPTGGVASLPDWTQTEYYTINAKAEDGVLLTREELAPRLHRLLVERFKLATHMETTYADGFALVLAKGGPKLKDATKPLAMARIGTGIVIAPSITMDNFVSALRAVVGQPVVNETGLPGTYDLTLTFAPAGAVDSPLPSIFTGVQEQLGLKLEGRKDPIETVVVDHVEHPTAD